MIQHPAGGADFAVPGDSPKTTKLILFLYRTLQREAALDTIDCLSNSLRALGYRDMGGISLLPSAFRRL
jgi:hypothetical protein